MTPDQLDATANLYRLKAQKTRKAVEKNRLITEAAKLELQAQEVRNG